MAAKYVNYLGLSRHFDLLKNIARGYQEYTATREDDLILLIRFQWSLMDCTRKNRGVHVWLFSIEI
jgi:hypothetical protein